MIAICLFVTALQDSVIPPEPLSSEAASIARLTLNRLIRYQLTRSQLPLRMRRFRVCEPADSSLDLDLFAPFFQALLSDSICYSIILFQIAAECRSQLRASSRWCSLSRRTRARRRRRRSTRRFLHCRARHCRPQQPRFRAPPSRFRGASFGSAFWSTTRSHRVHYPAYLLYMRLTMKKVVVRSSNRK